MTNQTPNGYESLKRKYFWSQKTDEILYFSRFVLIFAVIFAAFYYLLPASFYINSNDMAEKIGMCFALAIMVLGLGVIIKMIIEEWIKSNWELADRKARKKLLK